MIWVNFFHIYQPPDWEKETIRKVANESYRPFVDILKRNPQIKITLNISASLTEQLVQHRLTDIIDDLKELALKGQVEFTHSAKYHVILPLLPEEIIIRQIKLNQEVNEKYFGEAFKPKGFFPTEMSWSKKLVRILEKFKIDWVILDEISYNRKLCQVKFDHGYNITNSNIKVIFRNRIISNYFPFESDPDNPKVFYEKLENESRSKDLLITAMDGENLGHHRKGIDKLWERIVTSPDIKTMNCSELVNYYHSFQEIMPHQSSWSSEVKDFDDNIPYSLWHNPKNPIHVKQWELTNEVIKLTEKAKKQKDRNFNKTQILLDKALASDQYWWASMRPWWADHIIRKETRELADTITPLKSITVDEKEKIEKLKNEITDLVDEWEKSGKAEKQMNLYLKKTGFTPFIGGHKITSK